MRVLISSKKNKNLKIFLLRRQARSRLLSFFYVPLPLNIEMFFIVVQSLFLANERASRRPVVASTVFALRHYFIRVLSRCSIAPYLVNKCVYYDYKNGTILYGLERRKEYPWLLFVIIIDNSSNQAWTTALICSYCQVVEYFLFIGMQPVIIAICCIVRTVFQYGLNRESPFNVVCLFYKTDGTQHY